MFRGFKKGFRDFSHEIAIVANTVFLTVVYFTAVLFTSLLARIVGKHFLERRLSKESYWNELNIKKRPAREYLRQF